MLRTGQGIANLSLQSGLAWMVSLPNMDVGIVQNRVMSCIQSTLEVLVTCVHSNCTNPTQMLAESALKDLHMST